MKTIVEKLYWILQNEDKIFDLETIRKLKSLEMKHSIDLISFNVEEILFIEKIFTSLH